MATTLVYTKSAFTPFTKIVSADVNQFFTDIRSRINWAGTTSATTGLGDDNIQSITASGGGLTRATKLKAGTASYVLVNNGSGAMSEAAFLTTAQGGTGLALTLSITSANKVLAVNSAGTAFALSVTPVPPTSNVFNYSRYS